jgi:hypothetical protein
METQAAAPGNRSALVSAGGPTRRFGLFGHLSLRIRGWFSAILRRKLAYGAEVRVKTPKIDVQRSGYYLS